jgi:hypothetical protein
LKISVSILQLRAMGKRHSMQEKIKCSF